VPGVDTFAVFWSSVFRLSSSHYFFPLHVITCTLFVYVHQGCTQWDHIY
jgi:hypothetical protein